MAFTQMLGRYDKRFTINGSFRLQRGENLRTCIQRNQVPDMPAVYLIYAVRQRRAELLYIGKSGTLRSDGSFKNQMLATRLRMKQGKMWRAEFYAEQMKKLRLTALHFQWWVTFDDKVRIIPLKAEADLLQAFFDDHRRLPQWNLAA